MMDAATLFIRDVLLAFAVGGLIGAEGGHTLRDQLDDLFHGAHAAKGMNPHPRALAQLVTVRFDVRFARRVIACAALD